MSLSCKFRFIQLYFSLVCLLFLSWRFSAPIIVEAQTNQVQIQTLLVELWPEYDRPEVLVIYRIELSQDALLPTQLTFRLPGHIDRMNAVAAEQNGLLYSVEKEAVTLRPEGGWSLLTFPASSHRVQFEYYDPTLLSKQDTRRRLQFDFSADYEVETVTFEIQEPAQAEDFTLTPEPNRTFTDRNGLNYSILDLNGLPPGDTVTLIAAYQRPTDQFSAQLLGLVSEHTAEISNEPEPGVNRDITLAYILAGMGVVILLGAIGHWGWSNYRQRTTASKRRPSPRPARSKKRLMTNPGKAKETAQPAKEETLLGFCYKCGAALRPEANFCHHCGAERRRA